MLTERLEINRVTPDDRADYFYNISNDKKVLETFVCKYAESLDDYDFEPYLQMDNLFAIRLKETNKLIGIILHFGTAEEDACEIGYGIGSKYLLYQNGQLQLYVKQNL